MVVMSATAPTSVLGASLLASWETPCTVVELQVLQSLVACITSSGAMVSGTVATGVMKRDAEQLQSPVYKERCLKLTEEIL